LAPFGFELALKQPSCHELIPLFFSHSSASDQKSDGDRSPPIRTVSGTPDSRKDGSRTAVVEGRSPLRSLGQTCRFARSAPSSGVEDWYNVSAHFELNIAAIRPLAIAVCLAGCSSNPSAAHPETPEHASTATQTGSASTAAPAAPAEPMGSSLKGADIEAWFRRRGAAMPGTLNVEDSQCETMHAAVPSGQALSCEQHAVIRPWVRTTRRILFDVRDGRTLALVNLTSKVEPFAASSGGDSACAGALVVLRVQLSGDGKGLTVADDAGCGCEQAEKLLEKGTTGDVKAVELQTREVKQACSQRGAYVWEAHGYAPAQGE